MDDAWRAMLAAYVVEFNAMLVVDATPRECESVIKTLLINRTKWRTGLPLTTSIDRSVAAVVIIIKRFRHRYTLRIRASAHGLHLERLLDRSSSAAAAARSTIFRTK